MIDDEELPGSAGDAASYLAREVHARNGAGLAASAVAWLLLLGAVAGVVLAVMLA